MAVLNYLMKNLRKNKVIIVSLLVLILFMGGFFTGKVVFQEKKVTIPEHILNEFNSIYEQEQEETILCLVGERNLKGWKIIDTISPEIISNGENTIEYESCGTLNRNDIIGTWHNHKNGLCELSDSDIFAFGQDYAIYKIELSMVQCDRNRIGIFTKDIINREGYTFEQDTLEFEVA